MTQRRKKPESPKAEHGNEKGGETSFADLIEEIDDIERLGDDDRKGPYRIAPSPHPGLPSGEPDAEPMRFPKDREPLLARRAHLSPHRFHRLCAGRIPPDETLDLHGYDRNSAREALFETLQSAATRQAECVLVIHGKGHRSEGGESILKDSMPDWLTDSSLRSCVLGFAPALPRDGGTGAVYVLLSKKTGEDS